MREETYANGLAKTNGYRESGGCYVKENGDYILHFHQVSDNVGAFVRFQDRYDPLGESVVADMEGICKRYGVHWEEPKCNCVWFTFSVEGLSGREFGLLMEEIVEVLKEDDIEGVHLCPICHEKVDKDRDLLVRFNFNFNRLHGKCYKSLDHMDYEDSDIRERTYTKGILGEVLFGGGGLALWTLVTIVLRGSFIYGLFMGYLCQLGYEKFKGSIGKHSLIVQAGIGLVMAVIGSTISELIMVIKAGEPMDTSGLWIRVVLAVLFSEYAIWSSYKKRDKAWVRAVEIV